MSPKERIDEAHGLWEIAVTRLAALVECAGVELLAEAVQQERAAFAHWSSVTAKAIEQDELYGA